MTNKHLLHEYIHNPRTAGHSLHKALGTKCKRSRCHNRWIELQKPKHFTYCFVRNPWDRMVSWYARVSVSKDTGVDFQEWLMGLAEKKYGHVIPQDIYWEKAHFIGRFENLEEDWIKLCGILDSRFPQLGIEPAPLPFINHQPRWKDYRRYYDKDTRRLVRRLDRKTIKRFGYEF